MRHANVGAPQSLAVSVPLALPPHRGDSDFPSEGAPQRRVLDGLRFGLPQDGDGRNAPTRPPCPRRSDLEPQALGLEGHARLSEPHLPS